MHRRTRMRKTLTKILLVFAVAPLVLPAGVANAASRKPPAGYEALAEGANGPVHWDACNPPTWYMSSAHYTEARKQDAVKAFRQIRKASGLALYFGGIRTPEELDALGSNVITVSFVPSRQVRATLKNAIAYTAFGYDEETSLLTRADVVIGVADSWDPDARFLPTVLHEVGHAVGLGHAKSKRSLMHPYRTSLTKLSAEDVAAFRWIGVEQDCAP